MIPIYQNIGDTNKFGRAGMDGEKGYKENSNFERTYIQISIRYHIFMKTGDIGLHCLLHLTTLGDFIKFLLVGLLS